MIYNRLFTLFFILFSSIVFAQKEEKKVDEKAEKDSISSYEKIIDKALIQDGIFKVIQNEEDYYFQVPDSLLGVDMLIVNKISSVSSELNDAGVNRGMNYQNILLRFYKDKNNKTLWVKSFDPKINVSEEDNISQSVSANYNESIFEKFKIEAMTPDSTASIIKVNKVFDGSNTTFGDLFNTLGLGGSINKDLSFISEMKGFEKNVVVKSIYSTKITEGNESLNLSVGVTSNIVLLPENPMPARFSDDRIGYFDTEKWYYNDSQQEVDKRRLITRWRLEPKEEDVDKYLAGELVEPKQPIVFYIDPSTPNQWVPYIVQGILDWNVAFEEAGFKNAIDAKMIPEGGIEDFDIDDVRYSVLSYAASDKANAMGPSVVDPRSGEILESDVIWWHNVMTLIKDWMRVQTGIVDPEVRDNILSENRMGNAIRFVSSHEIGHTLGLKHNMGSSYAFDVEQLRSQEFTNEMGGTAPSIMDYARFNYVAQEKDGITQLTPELGVYDKFAIGWGYRWLPNKSAFENKKITNQWLAKHANDPLYFYGEQQSSLEIIDPRSQSEDIGNDAMKASAYGLINLEKTIPQILDWTREEQADYTKAGELYADVINQWDTYNYHVLNQVGGIYINPSVYGDGQKTFEPVPAEIQKRAVQYIINHVVTIPDWLINEELLQYVKPLKHSPIGNIHQSAYALFRTKQYSVLYYLFEDKRLLRLLESEFTGGDNHYKVEDLFNQMRKAVFPRKTILSLQERMTQKNYVDALIVDNNNLFEKTAGKSVQDDWCSHSSLDSNQIEMNFESMKRVSEVTSYKRGELMNVYNIIRKIKGRDEATKSHYLDLEIRIKEALHL
ncbi:MAG: zinc-dependent metalloprotease [Weeksellaceae bacterium]